MKPAGPEKTRVAIVEDSLPLRNELVHVLNESPELEVVVSISECSQLVPLFNEKEPQVVLMDIALKGQTSGIDGVKVISNYFPAVRTIMFTVFEDDDKIFESICAGAMGYILKKASPDEIIAALISLHQGGAPMTPVIANRALQIFRQKMQSPVPEYGLTPREREILQGLTEGLSYQKIADRFYIHISTVRTHISSIYHKLHVNTKIKALNKISGR